MRWMVVLALVGCRSNEPPPKQQRKAAPVEEAYDPFRDARLAMVERDIAPRGIADERVLEAMRSVPRHELVPDEQKPNAYADRALPIGYTKTISQPFIVAVMTEAARLRPGDKVLEIGTGSGYQAAVLAEMGNQVYTIEIAPELAERARLDLARIGYADVHVRAGDGYEGWPDAAPFDAILVTAAAPRVPIKLFEQLAEGGRMVLPIGDEEQTLWAITKTGGAPDGKELLDVRFGPMLGVWQ